MPDSTPFDFQAAYQKYFGRTPDAPGLAYWQQQAAAGVPSSRITDMLADTPEAGITNVYRQALGRTPDPTGRKHYLDNYAKMGGSNGVRADIQRQPEAQTFMLDNWDAYRNAARASTIGQNAMPGRFFDYGGAAAQQAGNPLFAPQTLPGPPVQNNLIESLLAMFAGQANPDEVKTDNSKLPAQPGVSPTTPKDRVEGRGPMTYHK